MVKVSPDCAVAAGHKREVVVVPEVETLWILVPTCAMSRLMTDQVHRMTVCSSRCGRKNRRHWWVVLRIGIDPN